MNGLLVLVGAILIFAMQIPARLAGQLYWMLVGTGYANTLFYWGALFAPSRALTFGDNRFGESNLAGVIGLLPAFIFAFITTIAMVMLARHAFRGTPEPPVKPGRFTASPRSRFVTPRHLISHRHVAGCQRAQGAVFLDLVLRDVVAESVRDLGDPARRVAGPGSFPKSARQKS
jgi:hypothetical protein